MLIASCGTISTSNPTFMLRSVEHSGHIDTNVQNDRVVLREASKTPVDYYSVRPTVQQIEEVRSTYENNYFNIVWHIDGTRLNFTITNKTSDILRIKWQDAAFVHIDGFTHRVYHNGLKYANKSPFSPDMIVPGRARYCDFVLPINNAYWNGTTYKEVPLIPSRDNISEHVGNKLSVTLPIEAYGYFTFYTFTFELDEYLQNK